MECRSGDLVCWAVPGTGSPDAAGPVPINTEGLYFGVVIRELSQAELNAAFSGAVPRAYYVHRPGQASRLPAQVASTPGGYTDVHLMPAGMAMAAWRPSQADHEAIAALLGGSA